MVVQKVILLKQTTEEHLDWDGIWSAIKFEATQIHFLRDVFVAGRGRRILKMDGV